MHNLLKKLLNPFLVTLFATFSSVIIYNVLAQILSIPKSNFGLMLSIFIPMIITLPVSFIIFRFYKKIEIQKEELQRMDVLNKKLFSIISHDIRSPLAALKGFTDLVANEDMDFNEGRKYQNLLSNRIDNLLTFLNDMLYWSKRQIDNLPLNKVKFNCKDLIYPILELYEAQIEEKKLQINIGNLDKEFFTEKENLSFILRNIFHNAIKFSENEGEISVYIEDKETEIHTVIKDNGVGISKKNIDRILNHEEVYSTKGTLNESGTGFGISMCLQYLKCIEGSLLIDSEISKGSKITVVLPKV